MKNVRIRGNNWKYQDFNTDKKEILLFVHGHPFNHSMWKYQYETLKNFRLILPDLRGYGKSDIQSKKIYIEEQALDLALLLDELDIQQIHLIGLSMGGQIIVEFQRLFPARVKSLTICASTPTAETTESYNSRLQLAESILQTGMEAYTRNDIHKYIHLDEIGTDTETYKHLFEMMSSTTVEGAVASHRGRAERRSNFEHLKYIQVPTLVIAGEKDFFFPIHEVEKVAREIIGAQFHVIEKSGHLPNMEQAAQFNALLINFLKHFSKPIDQA